MAVSSSMLTYDNARQRIATMSSAREQAEDRRYQPIA
jgi:hypothetical protein